MESRTTILKISLAGSGGVALGLVWGGLWLALNFFAYLGFDAMEDGGARVLRLAQVAIGVFLFIGTVAIAAALVHVARTLRAPVAVPVLAAFVTASMLSSVAVSGFVHQQSESGCSVVQWLPLFFPCPN